jgi:hypothetical protein
MALSDGRTDYFVQIKVGDRAVTPHVFREEYKSAYHVALYDWLLNGKGEEPDCVEFGPDDWPGLVMPAQPQPLPTRDQIADIIKDKVDYFLHDEQGPLDAADAILALHAQPQEAGNRVSKAIAEAHATELKRLGEMQANKSVGKLETSWLGGKVNGLAVALAIACVPDGAVASAHSRPHEGGRS